MKKIVPVLALFLLLSANLLAQVPQKLSWQAILRDDAGKPITAPVELLFTILDGNTAVFEEEKALTPNAFGLAVWNIGEKETAAFQAINWEGGPKRLKVAMRTTIGFGNFIDIGTESLRSVPYALVAEKVLQDQDNQNLTINGPSLSISGGNAVALPDASPTNELQTLSLSGANLTLSNGGGTVVLPAGKDTSATNELQTLSLAGADLSLSNGGGAVTLPDASATNEIQTITLSGPDIILSNSGGTVTLPDPSATNELQTLSLTGQTLALSNGGGTVTLPAGTAYTAGSGININGGVISNAGDEDNNPANEIQALSLTGQTLTLSNGGGAVTLPTYNAGSGININGNVISNAGDADNNPANEIQALSLSGPTLALSNGGGAVTLPDASATNELQTLSLSGADLTLSKRRRRRDPARYVGDERVANPVADRPNTDLVQRRRRGDPARYLSYERNTSPGSLRRYPAPLQRRWRRRFPARRRRVGAQRNPGAQPNGGHPAFVEWRRICGAERHLGCQRTPTTGPDERYACPDQK
jgi:phage tail protein X